MLHGVPVAASSARRRIKVGAVRTPERANLPAAWGITAENDILGDGGKAYARKS